MARFKDLAAALSTGVCIVALATPAQAQDRSFNVPSGPLRQALDAYVTQSGNQLIYRPEDLGNAKSKGVTGMMPARSALERVLAGTGFKAVSDPSGALAIVGNAIAGGPTAGNELASSSGEAAESEKGVADILVIGSRTQNVDIRRTENDAQPYVVFNKEQIEKSQARNIEEFLKSRLPQNAQRNSFSQPTTIAGPDQSNISQINLRGLGVDQTLILVDGRRAPRVRSNSGFSDFTQADINGIPLGAIERIEILPGTAGGIYGGGAVGGVVNIIRKRNYNGIEFRGELTGAFAGGGETRDLSVSGGFSPDRGTTQINFSVSLSDADPLYAKDNDLWKRARSRQQDSANPDIPLGYVPNVYAALKSVRVPVGTPGATCIFNIFCSILVQPNLTLKSDGTPLNSPNTFVPVGYSGAGSDGGHGLVDNAGSWNWSLSNDQGGRFAALLNNPKIFSVDVGFRRQIGEKLEAFGDFSYYSNEGRSNSLAFTSVFVPAGAANNPFNESVYVKLPTPGLDSPSIGKSTTLSATGGLLYRVSKSWSATIEYNWGRSRTDSVFQSAPLTPDFVASVTDGPNNPFRDINLYPLDFESYENPFPDSRYGPFDTLQTVASARASGKLLRLPAGPVTTTILLEHRNESAETGGYVTPSTDSVYPERSQRVLSAYGELVIPIFSPANSRPLLDLLEIQASLRHDAYKTTVATVPFYDRANPPSDLGELTNKVGSTSYTLAARWAPLAGVTFRSSFATGFLPPNIGQLVPHNAIVTFNPIYRDPKRGNELIPAPFTQVTQGNPNLEPEESKSLSFGAILEPKFAPGFRLSVDYVRIKKDSEIYGVSSTDINFLETYFPDRVVRNTDPATFGPYSVGPITSVDSTLVNVSKSKVSAIDFSVDYRLLVGSAGRLNLYGRVSRQLESSTQVVPTSESMDRVGFVDGPLKWRGNFGVDWELGTFAASLNTQFYDSYSVRYGSAPDADFSNAEVTRQGAERIPSQSYTDLYVRYAFDGSHVTKGLELALGVQNIFNKRPPVIVTSDSTGTYSGYGDPRLRRYSISFTKRFGKQ